MANTKSAIKNARKNTRRQLQNQRVKTRLKTLAKAVDKAAAGTDAEATRKAAQVYVSALDRAAKQGIVHKNSADRHKGICAKYLAAK